MGVAGFTPMWRRSRDPVILSWDEFDPPNPPTPAAAQEKGKRARHHAVLPGQTAPLSKTKRLAFHRGKPAAGLTGVGKLDTSAEKMPERG
ncbi:MAG: hypothetical protein BJ554DRAFT_6862 [Olpidium bornovanus]|uniref:Uncharacterized protein n=1 Tax=Olpidium bornovanus TaxID=278681 RepID=A0A8H8A1X4_9FUNG|nr:MAG: hypothetical protein BJ554DRAFT_6862 [Olpidium bornovanus]